MRIDPELDPFLTRHGLGTARPETAKHQNGRNANLLVVTTTGHALFVKRVNTRSHDAGERIAACRAFEELRRTDLGVRRTLGTAPLLACDPELGLLAYQAVTGATSLADLSAEDPQADGALAPHVSGMGRLLAAVHALDVERVPPRSGPPGMPPVDWLEELPWRMHQSATAPVLEVWRRLQGDPEVAAALRELRAEEDAAVAERPVAVHGDVRLDQLLVGHDGVLRLVDLEEFRRGDAARDVGAMVGEWLHRATLDIVEDHVSDPEAGAGPGERARAAVADLQLSHEEVVASGVAALERRRVVVERLWEAYVAAGGQHDPAFVERVTRFAGWHLFDRLIAVAEHTSRISAVHWAAAGIGRRALLDPRAAAPALGLPDPRTATTEETAA